MTSETTGKSATNFAESLTIIFVVFKLKASVSSSFSSKDLEDS